MTECPICYSALAGGDFVERLGDVRVGCPRCGEFALVGGALQVLREEIDSAPQRRAVTSHTIRRMQGGGKTPPPIDPDLLRAIWRDGRLPKPQRMADLLVLLIGEDQPSPGDPARLPIARIEAEIGAPVYLPGRPWRTWSWVLRHLRDQLLVEWPAEGPEVDLALTMDGWQRYELLQRETSESRTAFMAMKFGRPKSDAMYREHFIRAVAATGFELQRLDTPPKAGLIDARMEVDIRTARFLIADLTHGNRGAYWEAGFATGLGKPVFYTCEEGFFRRYNTHFDTNHRYIVMWNAEKPEVAAEDLKAVIRATLPDGAKMRDD